MATITTRIIDDEKNWEDFLHAHPEANFLQSWNWGEFHRNLSKQIFRTGFFEGDTLVGVMLSVVEPARRGRYLTVPGGPIIDWHDDSLTQAFRDEIARQARTARCVFVRVRPQLLDDEFSTHLFAQLGFRPAPTHLHAELTHQLDITQPEETLLANMRKGTRYEVKRGTKLGIVISKSHDPTDIAGFYNLQLETAQRQGFVPFSLAFLQKQFTVFAESGQATLYTATREGEVLAQAFIIFYGQEAVYHYGASTDAGRKYPGAYAIQWEAIREAKHRNMSRYNFWGVAPPEQPQHRFAGISIFKRGFGGHDTAYLHAHDLVINRRHYLVNLLIESIRRRIRKV